MMNTFRSLLFASALWISSIYAFTVLPSSNKRVMKSAVDTRKTTHTTKLNYKKVLPDDEIFDMATKCAYGEGAFTLSETEHLLRALLVLQTNCAAGVYERFPGGGELCPDIDDAADVVAHLRLKAKNMGSTTSMKQTWYVISCGEKEGPKKTLDLEEFQLFATTTSHEILFLLLYYYFQWILRASSLELLLNGFVCLFISFGDG